MIENAQCDKCPLRAAWGKSWNPVGFECNQSKVLVLGDAPSKQDMEFRIPFSDTRGAELTRIFKKQRVPRKAIDWGNLIACRWPKDDAKQYLATLKKQNRKRAMKGLPLMLSPIEACRPHVAEELQRYETIIPVGPHAIKALLAGNPNLEAVRGGPTKVGETKLLPTYHPRLMPMLPHLRPILASDIAKAMRHHTDQLNWQDPRYIINPSLDVARQFFARVKETKQLLAYDVETDDVESLTADLRCIGIGTTTRVLLIGFVSIDGETRFYSTADEEKMKDILRDVFTDRGVLKVGHNAGYFDRIVIEQHLGVTPRPLLDTLLLHKLAASEHRHSLGFIGSVLTDVPAWKADHTGVMAKTDEDLHTYCITDVCVTAKICIPLRSTAKGRKQLHLYKTDARLQDLCADMHRIGMRIDEAKRFEHEARETKRAAKWFRIIRESRPTLNPNSHVQLREILFDEWGLPPHEYTLSGEPSTGAATLRSLVVNPLVNEDQQEFINAVRFYRRSQKLLSTYLHKLAPHAGVVRDGYVYPDYNSHGTVTGRFSSSNPNFQNFPSVLRDMFIPPPGCVFVGADYDQLELRFAAALSGCQHYLDAFEKKEIDPHNLTGQLMFGDGFWRTRGAPKNKLDKGTKAFKDLRNVAKTICFASLYKAEPPKVHEILSRAEDDDGNLLYAHYSLRHVQALHATWLSKAPEIKGWWADTLKFWRKRGYVEEAVLGRRRYFDLHDPNAIINFGVQAGGFAVVALAMLDLVDNHIPFDFGQKTGLTTQLHDAVLFSVPESQAFNAQQVITDVLTRKVADLPVTFTATANIGENWKNV